MAQFKEGTRENVNLYIEFSDQMVKPDDKKFGEFHVHMVVDNGDKTTTDLTRGKYVGQDFQNVRRPSLRAPKVTSEGRLIQRTSNLHVAVMEKVAAASKDMSYTNEGTGITHHLYAINADVREFKGKDDKYPSYDIVPDSIKASTNQKASAEGYKATMDMSRKAAAMQAKSHSEQRFMNQFATAEPAKPTRSAEPLPETVSYQDMMDAGQMGFE